MLAPLASYAQTESEAAAVYRKVSDSVVTINCDEYSGTGFVVDVLPRVPYLPDWHNRLVANLKSTLIVPTSFTVNQAMLFVRSKSFIVTALHVIEDSNNIEIVFKNGTKAQAHTIFGVIPDIDLAILICDTPPPGTPLTLANYSATDVGSNAYVIGSPLGILTSSITSGIISGKRTIDGLDLIQYSTPISSGNSGGPIVDKNGEVIGIVTFSIKDTQNINFGIGSPQIKKALVTESATLTPGTLSRKTNRLAEKPEPTKDTSNEEARKVYSRGAAQLVDTLYRAYLLWDADLWNALELSTIQSYDGLGSARLFRTRVEPMTNFPLSATQSEFRLLMEQSSREKLVGALFGINQISLDYGASIGRLVISLKYASTVTERELEQRVESCRSEGRRLRESIDAIYELIRTSGNHLLLYSELFDGIHPGIKCFVFTKFQLHPDFSATLEARSGITSSEWNIRKGDKIIGISRSGSKDFVKVSNWDDIWEYVNQDRKATEYELQLSRGPIPTVIRISF
ncbi:serine protease [Kamptonema cortianum]|nr:serine protease [Kamptonema cortianum]